MMEAMRNRYPNPGSAIPRDICMARPDHLIPVRMTRPPWSGLLLSALLAALGLLPAVLEARADPLEAMEVAPGVYAFIADTGEVSPENAGRVGNSGFVVGTTGIAVIDTGVSRVHGEALLAQIRRVSTLPVTAIVITHAVQEFLFGAAAFDATGARSIAHRRSIDLMRQRCDHCLDNLRQMLGAEAMVGTRLVIPTDAIDQVRSSVDIGGRTLELLHPGWAATPGDLMVLDPTTGVLFAGGVVSIDRIPELRDADFSGWVHALREIPASGARIVVPGHGPPVPVARSQDTLAYLLALDQRMRVQFDAGIGLMDAIEGSGVPAFAGWAGYATIHRKNALDRYLQLELDDLAR